MTYTWRYVQVSQKIGIIAIGKYIYGLFQILCDIIQINSIWCYMAKRVKKQEKQTSKHVFSKIVLENYVKDSLFRFYG